MRDLLRFVGEELPVLPVGCEVVSGGSTDCDEVVVLRLQIALSQERVALNQTRDHWPSWSHDQCQRHSDPMGDLERMVRGIATALQRDKSNGCGGQRIMKKHMGDETNKVL